MNVMGHLSGQEHVDRYRATDGAEGYDWKKGTTCLILTTTGRKTGEVRDNALIFRDDDGRAVIVASKGGHPQHPAWFLNMQANPDEVEVQIKADRFKAAHRVAEGEERARLWDLMVQAWPDYESYQAKTDREIPVVVLERAA